jgi:hypothetical protein
MANAEETVQSTYGALMLTPRLVNESATTAKVKEWREAQRREEEDQRLDALLESTAEVLSREAGHLESSSISFESSLDPSQPSASPKRPAEEATEVIGARPTIMLTFGKMTGRMGQAGSFDSPTEWLGSRKDCLSQSTREAFIDLLLESVRMKAAIHKPFPVPEFKLREGEAPDLPEDAEIQEIRRLNNSEMSPTDKAGLLSEMMIPNRSCDSFESQGDQYYLYGPFRETQDLLDGLNSDPMLTAVHETWSSFETNVLDTMFTYGTLYLQIRWQGWYARPVLEMDEAQFGQFLAKADGNVHAAEKQLSADPGDQTETLPSGRVPTSAAPVSNDHAGLALLYHALGWS